MTKKGLFQCRKQWNALLAKCGEVATNATKAPRPFLGTETARDLLLHLDHPQIPLSLVVIKRHRQIQQEAEHIHFRWAKRSSRLRAGLCRGRSGSRLYWSDFLGFVT